MAYVVRKNRLLFRAFATREEAHRYEQIKKDLLHEHCCVCRNCPNTNYYAEHGHGPYLWHIDEIAVKSSNLQDQIFIVCRNRAVETGFATYEEASTYMVKQKEGEEDSSDELLSIAPSTDYWSIVICRYSPLCLYTDQTTEELEAYDTDEHFHYQIKRKGDITNAI